MNLKRCFDIRQWLPSRRRTLNEIDEEFHFHLQQRTLDSEAEGMEPAEARRDAERRFGDARHYREQGEKILHGHVRKQARASFLVGLAHDLRSAVRALRRRPGFTVAAVLTLALGIGANAAMFGVIKTVVLAPLPFKSPDRVVQLWDHSNRRAGPPEDELQMSIPNFREYRSRNDVFSHFAAIYYTGGVATGDEDRASVIPAAYVSADLFTMMGVAPFRGRTFRADEDLDGAGNVVLLSHGYWLRELGGEDVIGQTIPLWRYVQGEGYLPSEYEVVGVLPPDFRMPPLRKGANYAVSQALELILPVGLDQGGYRTERRFGGIRTLAQLREGVTVEQARTNLQSIADGMAEIAPETEAGLEVTVFSVGDLLRQEYGVALGFLWAATALVLLVACASVSSLLLGWGVARERELAVRAALGAGARRIFSQLLTEATVLGGTACVLGVLLAYWGIAALKMFSPDGVHRLDQAGLDAGVLAFAVGVSLASVLLVGLWPAARGARRDSSEVLKAGGRGATLARTRSLRVLVTAEVALSLVLLAGAGLMLQSFWNLVGVDTGVGERVVHVKISLPPPQFSKYNGPSGWRQLHALLRDRVESIPGVAAYASGRWGSVPLSGVEPSVTVITLPDRPRPEEGQRPVAHMQMLSAGYFRTMGFPMLEGRAWNNADIAANEARWNQQVAAWDNGGDDRSWLLQNQRVVINAAMARKVWPGESPLGKVFFPRDEAPDVIAQTLSRIRRGEQFDPQSPLPWFGVGAEVIGVAQDVQNTLGVEPRPTFYLHNARGENLFVRASVEPAALAEVLRREIVAVDPNEIEVRQIRTLDQMVAEQSADSRFRAQLVVLFAVLATGITCLGLFGVLTYAVTQRTRELGIRMALGAAHSNIAGLVLGQGARMVGLGVALGFVLVFWVTRYVSSLLFGVVPLDPTTLAGVAVLIFALALAATYLPARRAMRVDPIEALRQE